LDDRSNARGAGGALPACPGKLRLPIDCTFRLDEAAAAQAHMRANQDFGKIVLTR
jgi:NADPH:quinone reductase-like Zn-dependent oxidoreductase